jgi:hypothetical protein
MPFEALFDGGGPRSMQRIEITDLHRLAAIAAEVEADLFDRHPTYSGRYAGRLVCRALCQGAAAHYPAEVLRGYLSAARTASARALAVKAAVLISPSDRAGEVVWPTG